MIQKNKAQFQTNSMLKDELKKKNQIEKEKTK